MLVTTRPRPTHQPSPPPHPQPPHNHTTVATIIDALLREHLDASAMLGSMTVDAFSAVAPTARELSREARDVGRALLGDGAVEPPAPLDAPVVVIARDLAVAQRTLAAALTTRARRAHCAMLMRSLARVAELRDAIATETTDRM